MSIPGKVFDCQHAHRDRDELHNYSRNLATLLAILRPQGIEKSGSEEPLRSIPFSCLPMTARHSLDGGDCLKSIAHHAVFIGTCTRGMTIPSDLFSEMHLGKFPEQPKFQSWIVDFRAEICAKAKNLALER